MDFSRKNSDTKNLLSSARFSTTLLLFALAFILFNAHFDVVAAPGDVAGGGTKGFVSKWVVVSQAVAVSVDPTTITFGGSTTITWSSNPGSTCVASGGWSQAGLPDSGTHVVNNITSSTTFTITCVDTIGDVGSDSSTVDVVDIKANSSDASITISAGDSVTIAWTSGASATCTGTGGLPGFAGAKPSSGSQTFNNVSIVGTIVFTITCDGISDSVTVNVNAPVPSVSNVTTRVSSVTYCLAGLHAGVEGMATDPINSNITAYEMQIDDDADPLSGNPEWESGTVVTDLPAGSTVTAGPALCNAANVDATPQLQCQMAWNTTYRSWIRVKNSYNQWSPWVQMSQFCSDGSCNAAASWTTPAHGFPSPNFSYLPTKPTANAAVTFTDATSYAPGSIGHTWNWNFGGGVPGVAVGQGPQLNTYLSTGIYDVTLTSGDNAGACSVTHPINVQKPQPKWYEVLPK